MGWSDRPPRPWFPSPPPRVPPRDVRCAAVAYLGFRRESPDRTTHSGRSADGAAFRRPAGQILTRPRPVPAHASPRSRFLPGAETLVSPCWVTHDVRHATARSRRHPSRRPRVRRGGAGQRRQGHDPDDGPEWTAGGGRGGAARRPAGPGRRGRGARGGHVGCRRRHLVARAGRRTDLGAAARGTGRPLHVHLVPLGLLVAAGTRCRRVRAGGRRRPGERRRLRLRGGQARRRARRPGGVRRPVAARPSRAGARPLRERRPAAVLAEPDRGRWPGAVSRTRRPPAAVRRRPRHRPLGAGRREPRASPVRSTPSAGPGTPRPGRCSRSAAE